MIDQSMFWKFLTTILAGTNFEIRAFLVRMILTNTFLTFKDNLVPRLSLSCSPPPPSLPQSKRERPWERGCFKEKFGNCFTSEFFFYETSYLQGGIYPNWC